MRNIKELLTVMLENENLFITGMCQWVWHLKIKDYITPSEYGLLRRCFINNQPWVTNFKINYIRNEYWWKADNIKPRIRWIKNI